MLAWYRVGIIALLFCLIYGLPNFYILATYLTKRMSLRSAACWTAIGFGLSAFVLLTIGILWFRCNNRSFREVGWGKPTKTVAMVVGVLFALAWLSLGYMNNQRLGIEFAIAKINLAGICAVLLTVFAGGFVEEIAMRGVIMKELHDIGARTWLQVLISGFSFALYHSVHFIANPLMFIPGLVFSMFMGCILAWIFVLGKRSLTPCILCHGLINLLGEPYLLMGALAVQMKHG